MKTKKDHRNFQKHSENVNEIIFSEFNFRLHDVQVQGGLELLNSTVVEMATGEGKTLTAVLPISIIAQDGKGILVATANDYLAQRDALWMRPIFEKLDLSVGFVKSGLSFQERQKAYQCDITYGTIREFGFDFLKDRLAERSKSLAHLAGEVYSGSGTMQREPYALLVDEADNILIDDARMPLLISRQSEEIVEASMQSCYRWCAEVAPLFEPDKDYLRLERSGEIALTPKGKSRFFSLDAPVLMKSVSMSEILHRLEIALYVNHVYVRDQHYIVKNGEILIVDELTGRTAAGRIWGNGIHQAIEARENVDITAGTETVANITVNEFVNKFPKVCGMTGTAFESRLEFQFVYGLNITQIPTHEKVIRKVLDSRAFLTNEEKCFSIIEEIQDMQETDRPVMIGTRTVENSEKISELLKQNNINHQLLNAKFPDKEASVIAQAGQPSSVTIATNMAGRGTDIKLCDQVKEAGGLHVINFELNGASRIDRQLAGRCGRQGDPGTFRQYLSLEDEIIEATNNGKKAQRMISSFQKNHPDRRKIINFLLKCQKKYEHQQKAERELLAKRSEDLNEMYSNLGLDPVLDSISD